MKNSVLKRLYSLRERIVDTCTICGGVGYLPEEHLGIANPCVCMQVFNYVMELVEAGIAQDYWHLELTTLKMDAEYIKLVKHILKNIHRFRDKGLGLLFHGVNGVGKTSLMAEIGKEAIVQGYKVKYLSAQAYVDAVRADDTAKQAFFENDFILLDELDKVYIKQGSNFVPKTLEIFLRDAMVNFNVSVIGATNLDMHTFTKIFGESTVSMLKRKMRFIGVDGDDYSDILIDSWGDKLAKDYDYFAPAILNNAKRRQQIILERELAEWEM